jgi:predicted enzyme related to lactoylglutathione lyase
MGQKMSPETNALNWFEISVSDIERAKTFYEKILDVKMESVEMMGMKMAMFPYDGSKGTVGGALVQSQMHHPSTSGVFVYLNANPDLQQVVDRVEKAGGKIIMQKTMIDEQVGYMAFLSDTEGNSVGLHSNK